MEERERAMEQAHMLKMKKVWLEFEEMREQLVKLKKQKEEKKAELKKVHACLLPLEEEHVRLASKKKKLHNAWQKHEETVRKCSKELEKQGQKFEKHDDEQELLIADLNQLDSRRVKLQNDVEKCQEKLDSYDKVIKDFRPPEELEEKLQDATQKRRLAAGEHNAAKTELAQQQRDIADLEDQAKKRQNNLAKLKDLKSRQKGMVCKYFEKMQEVTAWVDANRNLFRKSVTGPIAAEMSCKSKTAALYLEQLVANSIWRSFVVETREDQDLLYKSKPLVFDDALAELFPDTLSLTHGTTASYLAYVPYDNRGP